MNIPSVWVIPWLRIDSRNNYQTLYFVEADTIRLYFCKPELVSDTKQNQRDMKSVRKGFFSYSVFIYICSCNQ